MGKPYISVLERNMSNPEYRKQLEQQQALKADTTLENLLAAPVRGAMALASPMRGGAAKSTTTPLPGDSIIGKNVARDDRQKELIADIVKKTGKNPFEHSPEILKKQKNARILGRVSRENLEDVVKNQAYGVASGSNLPENKKKGGMVVSASKRGDGIAQRGKTRGKMR